MSSGQSNIAKFRVLIQQLGLEKLKGSHFKWVRETTQNSITKMSPASKAPLTIPFNISNLSLYLSLLSRCYVYDGDCGVNPLLASLRGALGGSPAGFAEARGLMKPFFSRQRGLGRRVWHLPTAALKGDVYNRLSFALERANARLWQAAGAHGGGRSAVPPSSALSSSLSSPFFLSSFSSSSMKGRRKGGLSTPFEDRWDDLQRRLAVLGRVSTGNAITAYRDNDAAFAAMWAAVHAATREVWWQTYICKDDTVGGKTLRQLVMARLRNCAVELLYDSGGNISGRTRLTEELKHCGGTVITYRPFFTSALKYFLQGLDWRKSPGLRNHRKILLVDGKVGFCGGLNIGNEYCGQRLGGTNKFRDTHCAVRGPVVAHLREVYDDTKAPQTWKYGWARWRQIASNALNQRLEVGRQTVKTGILWPIQNGTRKVTERGGIYYRQQVHRAEKSTERIMRRIRWEKQWQKVSKWVTWYNKRVSTLLHRTPDATTHGSSQNREGASAARNAPSEERGRLGEEQPDLIGGENPGCGIASMGLLRSESTFEKPFVTDRGDEASHPPEAKLVEDSNCVNNVKCAQSAAMQRRVAKERIQALYKATNIAHKRSWTNMLLDIPIADNDPVPEAEEYSRRRPATTQILSCNPRYHDYSIQYAFWQIVRKCHRRIWITTPYYLPTRKLFSALLHAASRGVDVRILSGSNQTTDPWFMWHASRYVSERLIRGGVRVYEYKGNQIMHAKTMVVDSVWSSIGSYNWDVMSDKNLEVCVCHFDAKFAREMEAHFIEDLALSEEVKLEDHQKRSLWLRFTSFLFYNFVYVLQRIAFFSFSNEDLEAPLYTLKR